MSTCIITAFRSSARRFGISIQPTPGRSSSRRSTTCCRPRPEMREFLRGRYMVPYQEEWMGAVDSMKKLQGWTDTTITHFYELAVTGERILLSVRYGDWSDIENIEDQAKTWARSCKPEIQRYIHSYRTVTGVDLAAEITDSRDAATRYLRPSVLIQRRLMEQSSGAARSVNGPDLLAARAS